MSQKRYFWVTGVWVAVVLAIAFYVPDSDAGVVTATRGRLAGSVSISGATPNTANKEVQISLIAIPTAGDADWVDTGARITTGATGSGSVGIPNNLSVGLNPSRKVRVICPSSSGPDKICGPVPVKQSKKWFASYTPGIQQVVDIVIAQSTFGDDGVELLETWEVGAIWSLILNPSEATWFDTGFGHISSSTGDLLANIIDISSSAISFKILSDLTPFTANSIFISGVGLDVLSGVESINPMYGITGNTSAYLDGNLLLSQSLSGAIVSAPSISSVPIPGTGWLVVPGLLSLLAKRKKNGTNNDGVRSQYCSLS